MSIQNIDVKTLRELFRNLQLWESACESDQVDVLRGPHGEEYHITDIQYLYECRHLLSSRQKEAIEMYLYNDIRERDVTLLMGVSPTNPVAMYATNGLVKLVELIKKNKLDRFKVETKTSAVKSYITVEEAHGTAETRNSSRTRGTSVGSNR